MSAHPDAFSQVKNILGRLDRSIDEARAKRLNPGGRSENPTNGPDLGEDGDTVVGGENANGYGKARPLRREENGGFTPFRR
ncbi:MAG: hypothetical protein AAGG07_08445 [Planctomycetota bacterium]